MDIIGQLISIDKAIYLFITILILLLVVMHLQMVLLEHLMLQVIAFLRLFAK